LDLGGKEQVSVAVRHRIEDLGNSSGTMLRLGGLNKVSLLVTIHEVARSS
jgi:hypothetical protein